MTREALVTAARRTMNHALAGTTPTEPASMRVPIANYLDEARWQLEIDRVFRRLPLMLAPSCQLPTANSYVALDAVGVPVLLVRGDDGIVRGFVNTCSHRGAIVVPAGMGSGRRFSCPYHAWTYDGRGDLVGVLDRQLFGEVDLSCHGLTPLPVAERAGIVFGGVAPGGQIDVDAYLCGYGKMLAHLGLADGTYIASQVAVGANWKLCYDGYVDFYHLPILHRNTFGPTYNNRTVFDAWGPHQRLTSPDQRMADLAETPEDAWPMRTLTGGVWTIFPHVSIASFSVGTPERGGRLFMISQLFPGATPGESVTTQHFVAELGFVIDDEMRAKVDATMEFLLGVVRDEDYATGFGIQRALRSGAKREVVFGRNEGPAQRFHTWLDRLVAASTPADTAALLAAADEYHQS